jgi:hypothetical protein
MAKIKGFGFKNKASEIVEIPKALAGSWAQ